MKTIFPIDANVEHTGYSEGRQGQDAALYDEGKRENNMAAGQNDQQQGYGTKDDSMGNTGSSSEGEAQGSDADQKKDQQRRSGS